MKYVWMLILMFPCFVLGADRTVSYADQVSGTLYVTNSTKDAAYELKHVSFALVSTNVNVFSITNIRTYVASSENTTVVTNEAINPATGSAWVLTNSWHSLTPVTFTNSYTLSTTTNNTSLQTFDTDDFPKGWTREFNDLWIYTFTDTNNINLIRVYDVYQRP